MQARPVERIFAVWWKLRRQPRSRVEQVAQRDVRHTLRRWSLVAVAAVVVLAFWGVGWYWSREPAPVDPTLETGSDAVGVATTQALIDVTSTLLDKPGGYLRNDVMPPGVLLDNAPSWEYGVLVEVRALTHTLRNEISRPQAQSPPDPDLSIAEPRLNVDSRSWILPRDESAYGEAVAHLRHYQQRLQGEAAPAAYFQARAKNLTLWLEVVSRRLAGISERLQLGASEIPIEGTDGGAGAKKEPALSTSWWQTDDVFYEARGNAWALLGLVRGLEVDFHDVLEDKNALSTFRNLEHTLAAAERPMESPMVLSGGGFGIVASHDLAMAAYLSSAVNVIETLQTLMRND
jgi:hypothetical protein